MRSVRTPSTSRCWSWCRAGLAGAAVLLAAASLAGAQSFDGITIITFDGKGGPGGEAIADGDHIVTFVSARGAYASVATNFRGIRRGCLAEAVPGSYTGRSIAFGIDAPLERRKFKLETLCPTFTLTFEDAQNVRVAAGNGYSRLQRVVARIPLVAVDFGAPHFARHEIRGVQLGPVLDRAELGPLRHSLDRYRGFRRRVGGGNDLTFVQGSAAAAEITGWPWDVLYDLRFSLSYDQKVTSAAFRDAAIERYGPPSSERPGNLVWLYDLAGNLVRLSDPMTNSCRATAEYWLAHDATTIDHVDPDPNSSDFGPWGCSVIMEMNARSSDQGVDGFTVRLWSGYAIALNHFFQRLEEPKTVARALDELYHFEPHL
jgi:hypothetical protein